MAGEADRDLAFVVVEADGVSLYYQGVGSAHISHEHVSHDKLGRIIISLRDPDGPCVWVQEEPGDVPPGEKLAKPGA